MGEHIGEWSILDGHYLPIQQLGDGGETACGASTTRARSPGQRKYLNASVNRRVCFDWH
jgi:hypothetical protein